METTLREPVAGSLWAGILANDRWIIFAFAVGAAAIWYFSEPIVFTNDSFGYLGSAKYLVGLTSQGVPYYRMPLFPIFLVATGVAYDTFTWFVLAQTTLGILMVMIFHDGLRAYSRPAAFIAASIFIMTFVSFVYSKSVMTEQLYLFGLVLCVAASLKYFRSGTRWHLALIAVAIMIMMLTRVQGFLIGAVVLPFLLYVHSSQWRSILAAAAVVLFVVGSYAVVYSMQVRKHNPADANAAPSLSNAVGKYLFMVPYLDAERYFGWRIVLPQNGPASKKMFELVSDTPADLAHWWAIWQGLDQKIGVAAANQLLLQVTIEAALAHPFKSAAVYGHNLLAATYRLNSPYVWQHPPVTIASDRLDREFKRSGNQAQVTVLAHVLNPFFHACLLAATVFMLLMIGNHGPAWLLCLSLYAYNILAIAASGAPEGRVVFYGLPVLLAALVTAQSQPWLAQLWRRNTAPQSA